MTKKEQEKLNKTTNKLLKTLSYNEQQILLLNAEYGPNITAQKLGKPLKELEKELKRLKDYIYKKVREELPKLKL